MVCCKMIHQTHLAAAGDPVLIGPRSKGLYEVLSKLYLGPKGCTAVVCSMLHLSTYHQKVLRFEKKRHPCWNE